MPDPEDSSPPTRARSIGLVLGAGGVPAYAFHTGALAGLADAAGWDARSAELIIGTSAGAGAASMLRAGLAPLDNYAHALGRPLSAEGEEFYARLPAGAWDSGADGEAGRLPASAALAARGLLRWPPRPGLAVAGGLPRGRRSPAPMGARHRALHPQWPARSLWICAVRLRDGRRVVFGRDDHPPLDVGDAVQASSAVPGFFTPVEIGGEDYVDGGTWSVTNADLTRGLGFDAVVVLAPLSTPHGFTSLPGRLWGRAPSWGEPARAAYRAYHRAVLEAEIRRVRQAGTPVIAIEPTDADLEVLQTTTADGRRPDIVERIYTSVVERVRNDAELTALLTAAVPV